MQFKAKTVVQVYHLMFFQPGFLAFVVGALVGALVVGALVGDFVVGTAVDWLVNCGKAQTLSSEHTISVAATVPEQ